MVRGALLGYKAYLNGKRLFGRFVNRGGLKGVS